MYERRRRLKVFHKVLMAWSGVLPCIDIANLEVEAVSIGIYLSALLVLPQNVPMFNRLGYPRFGEVPLHLTLSSSRSTSRGERTPFTTGGHNLQILYSLHCQTYNYLVAVEAG